MAVGLVIAGCSGGEDTSESGSSEAVSSTTTPIETTTSPSAEVVPDGDGGNDGDRGQLVPAGCGAGSEGGQQFDTDAGGPTVGVRVYVPAGAGSEPLPVVLNWHGLGSNGTQQALLSAYENLADDEGFLAVHPTGADNSWELAQFDVPGRDDVAMVDDVIDRLITEFCADPTRIYSTGLSNGGFFTALLICERADRIAAGVSVAGVSHPDGCAPSRPVPFIAFHGTDDDVVPFAGGGSTLAGAGSDAASTAFFQQSMPEEFAEFAADFGCLPDPEATPVGDEVTRNDYLGCDDDVPLSFYEIEGGGHTWPGSPLGPLLTGALGRTTDEVSATRDGWAFMSQFSLPTDG